MGAPTTLLDAWDDERADYLPRLTDQVALAQLRRTYMAGALAALDLQRAGATRERLMAEVVAFGRAIGTAVETAR